MKKDQKKLVVPMYHSTEGIQIVSTLDLKQTTGNQIIILLTIKYTGIYCDLFLEKNWFCSQKRIGKSMASI